MVVAMLLKIIQNLEQIFTELFYWNYLKFKKRVDNNEVVGATNQLSLTASSIKAN